MIRLELIGPVGNRCGNCSQEAGRGAMVLTVADYRCVLCRRCLAELKSEVS